MKNPNGYGSVFKFGGNRRRPWCARVTVGWSDDGKQKYKNIGYYEEREEAMIALAQYNCDPYDLDSNRITFSEVYEKWSEEKFPKISKSNAYCHKAAYAKCSFLYDMKFKQIRKMHTQRIINENEHLSSETRKKIKNLLNQMYSFALENDIVNKNYAEFIEIGDIKTKIERKPFTQEEIDLLWKNLNAEYVDTLLIMIYTGLRIGELLEIKCENIDIEKRIMIGGLKTKAGKDRTIPIHKKILLLIESKLDQEYLVLDPKGKTFYYQYFHKQYYKPLVKQLGLNHKPHDCRHTAITAMKNAKIDDLLIKKIVGHSSKDITDRVYTHITNEQLVEAIDKLRI